MSRVTLRLRVLVCGAAALFAVPVYAELTQKVKLTDYFGNTNGGEFLAEPEDFTFTPAKLGGVATDMFETFCVERNEYIAFNTTYFVDVTTAAVNGGLGGGTPDPLSPLTAYLYEEFITGNLTGYVYDVSDGGVLRAASADVLQHVVWFLEEEEGISWTPGDGSLPDQFYQDALANAGSSIGNVRVLNLYADAWATQPAQDQLVMIPEPASVMLAVVGFIGAALRRRS